jgi:hypothetical protein
MFLTLPVRGRAGQAVMAMPAMISVFFQPVVGTLPVFQAKKADKCLIF